MKLLTLILITFFISSFATSQELDFDNLYMRTMQDIMVNEPEKSLNNVDYLYEVSKDDAERIRALVLKADFLMYYGLNDEAQIILFKSEALARKNEDYISLTRIYGYISSLYRESELYSSSLKYLDKAAIEIEKIEDEDMKWRFKGNIEQEKANIELDNGNYHKSIAHARKSIQRFLKVKSKTTVDINYQQIISNGIISEDFLNLNELDSSFHYLAKAQDHLNKTDFKSSPLEGSIFSGIAQVYFAEKSYEKAEEYFLKAKEIADEAKFFDLKKDIYKLMCDLYKETNQDEKFIALNEDYVTLVDQDERSRKVVADKLLNSLYDKQLESEVTEQKNSQIIAWLIAFSLSLVIILIWYIYNKKQNQKKFEAFIHDLNNKTIDKVDTSEADNSKRYISEEKEKSIMQSLKDLENAQFYLDENISLTGLSSKIGVNQRYLTYVIKQHLAPDFATYINELRINYIVHCIKSDPKFLLYKISYLAQYCGFASHSRFSINFKKITGTTPSAFINYVKEENEKMKKES
ncbi:helix-turn-helix domain-containing protein [Brumimicrobium glaciale]|nr:helix-turn-helix domain-containing protein [Brumimicrobium glaciale]